MKKRLLIGLIAICMAAVMLMAEGIALADTGYAAEVLLADGTLRRFNDYEEAWELANEETGSVITMLSDWKLRGNTLTVGTSALGYSSFTLDLNGYSIDGGGERIITVKTGLLSTYYKATELMIIDTSTSKSGTLTNGAGEFGGGIYVAGKLYFNGGTLKNCRGSNTGSGAGIYVEGVSNSGVIKGYPAGELTLNGGRIENCSGASEGGGISSGKNAKLFLESGGIYNCSCTDQGGGVNIGIGVKAEMDKGFTISGCSAKYAGGGIHIQSSGELTMNGGTIKNCSAEDGGGIYIRSAGNTVDGKHLDAGKAMLYGGTISGNACTSDGGGVCTHGEILSAPSRLRLANDITVYGNTKNGKQNNIYLDEAMTDSNSVYFSIDSDYLTGKIGVYADSKRRVSEHSAYAVNRDHIFSDDSSRSIMYSNNEQHFCLTDYRPMPAIESVELKDAPEGTKIDFDYNSHIITVTKPGEFSDVETVIVKWTGETLTVNDGAWHGNYSESPVGIQYFNAYGVTMTEQNVLITNTIGYSCSWLIRIREGGQEEFFVCNGTLVGYTAYQETSSTNTKYYAVFPGKELRVVADNAPDGMVFDKWLKNRASETELGDKAYDEVLVISMPHERFGVKATYKAADTVLGAVPGGVYSLPDSEFDIIELPKLIITRSEVKETENKTDNAKYLTIGA